MMVRLLNCNSQKMSSPPGRTVQRLDSQLPIFYTVSRENSDSAKFKSRRPGPRPHGRNRIGGNHPINDEVSPYHDKL